MSADDRNPSPIDPDFPSLPDLYASAQDESEGGNRPAEGARHATPGEVLFEGFQGGDDAGDFLGLDTELHFGADMSMSPADGELDLEQPPGEYATGDTGFEGGPDAGALTEDGLSYEESYDAAPEEPYDHLDADFAADLEDEYGEYEERSEGPSVVVLAASAFVVGLLIVLGAVYGPGLASELGLGGGQDQVPVASNGTRTPQAGGASVVEPGAETTADASDADTGSDAVDGTDGAIVIEDSGTATDTGDSSTVVQPVGPVGGQGSLERLFSSDTFRLTVDPDAGSADGTTSGATTIAQDGVGGAVATGKGSDVVPVDPGAAVQSTDGADGGPTLDASLFASMAWVPEGQLDMVWRGTDAPMAALASPTRIAMPRVGAVRVHMKSGELFEGRLVAMGEGKIWIETGPGRMAFEGDEVSSLEHLGNVDLKGPGAISSVARGDRVRIAAPGGAIFGRVLVSDGDFVTVLTDDGARVTIAGATIEPVGTSRVVLVQN